MSFRALARQLGLSAHSGLADYESGRRIPPEDLILVYERVFDVPTGTLKELRNRAFAERAERRRLGEPAPVTVPGTETGPGRGGNDGNDQPSGDRRIRGSGRRYRLAAGAVIVAAVLAAAGGVWAVIDHNGSTSAHVQAARTPSTSPAPGIVDINGHGIPEPVRRIGSVNLPLGRVIDLDSLSADWELTKAPRGNPYDVEFTIAHMSLDSIDNADIGILPPGSAGTRKECGKLQAYGVELSTAGIRPGVLLCAITDQRRYALLRITNVQRNAAGQPIEVTLSIRVWERRDAT